MSLLSVQGLRTVFDLDEGELRAVDDVSFDIDEGETVALVGESGCGKSIVALSVLGLVPRPGRVEAGRILFRGRDLRTLDSRGLRRVRGGEIGIVFQEPGAALNPVFPVGAQIAEVLRVHRGMGREDAWREAERALGDVGIPDPEKRSRSYPFELSGGMRQRAVIALATCTGPSLLLADEPTTALDVTVQAEIMDLLADLQSRRGLAILFITHDLGLVAEAAARTLVMHAGRVVETGATGELFRAAMHPYTRGLLSAVLRLGSGRLDELGGIPGSVPDLFDLPEGCAFRSRCPRADGRCSEHAPELRRSAGRSVACHHPVGP